MDKRKKQLDIDLTESSDCGKRNGLDLIRRQDAIDALQKEINKGIPPFDDVMGAIRCGVRLARNIIEDLPSAEPRCIATIQLSREQLDEAFEKVKSDILSVKPKTGKWTIEDVHSATYKYCCSECKAHHRARYDFCPTCGAKMLEEGGEDDE